MRRMLVIQGAVIALLVVAVVGVASSVASTPSVTTAETIRTFQQGGIQRFVDADNNGAPNIGDYLVINGPLYQASNHSVRIGHLHAICTIVDRAFNAECSITAFLDRRGAITSSGPNPSQTGASALSAVTGGTGGFQNTRGQVRMTNTGPTSEELDYYLLP